MAKVLTDKAVMAARAGAQRREVPDGLLPGLYLVIQPSGAKSWAVRYRHAGKPRKIVLGPLAPKLDGPEPSPLLDAPLTLAGARKLARGQLQTVAAGRDPATEKVKAKRAARDPAVIDRDLFETVARQFILRYAKPKNRSWAESARLLGLVPDAAGHLIVKGGVAAKWRGKRIQDITRRDVIDLLDEIHDRAPVAANHTLAAVRRMLNWCVERDILKASPAAGVKPPAPMRSRDRVLSDDELARVWCAARAMSAPFGPIIRLLILTGARREEIGRLTWKEIQGDTIQLAGERTKTDTAHTIPLSECARNILATAPRIGRAHYVFTTTGETPVSGWSKAKSTLDARTGTLPGWRIHDLRRTIATGLQRLGFKLEIIEAVLGHTSGSRAGIVGVYQRHSFMDEKREALDAWSRYVTLLGRPMLWAKVRKQLDEKRERDREFCQMIKADRATWTKYVIGIARPSKPQNVTALKRGAR